MSDLFFNLWQDAQNNPYLRDFFDENGNFIGIPTDPSLGSNGKKRVDLLDPESTKNYQPNSNPYYTVNPNRTGKTAAQDTRAELARAEFEDYKSRYLPLEESLIQAVGTDYQKSVDQDLSRTRTAVTGAFRGAEAQQDRNAGRYGLAAQPAAYDMAETSAMVGGLNSTRIQGEDRRLALLSGGMNAISKTRAG